jgi:hypothetical protein
VGVSNSQLKLSVEKRIEILTQTIIRARIYYDLWWFLEGEETLPKIIDTLNDYSDFFRFTRHSYFVSIVVHSAIVWDKARDNINLEKVARDVLDKSRFPAHEDIEKKIECCKNMADGLVTIRHNAIAHRSATETYNAVFQNAGIIPNTIPIMMASWLDITNDLRKLKGLEVAVFRDIPLQNLQSMIRQLGGPDLKPKSFLDEILQP